LGNLLWALRNLPYTTAATLFFFYALSSLRWAPPGGLSEDMNAAFAWQLLHRFHERQQWRLLLT